MSKLLSFECDWLDQPAATDPLERRTWASFGIHARSRIVTRLFDRRAEGERRSVDVPVFPVAAWLVKNWWALLYEAPPGETIPDASVFHSHEPHSMRSSEWLRRHCLRTAESGLMLPRFCIFGDDDCVGLYWQGDASESYSGMPGYFIDSGQTRISRPDAEEALKRFVGDVLDRVQGENDDRVRSLRANWQEIKSAAADERAFCEMSGRLGLDPYASDDWDAGLVRLLEEELDFVDQRCLVEDVLTAVQLGRSPMTSALAHGWSWVRQIRQRESLGASSVRMPRQFARSPGQSPAEFGYLAAQSVRWMMEPWVMRHDTIENLDVVLPQLGLEAFSRQIDSNTHPQGLRAVVGFVDGRTPLAVLSEHIARRDDSRRFLEARALFFAATACDCGPRVVSDAYTFSQKASRAFAAELLAPRISVDALYSNQIEDNEREVVVQDLARRFKVSTKVIEHQLENLGAAALY